MMGLRRILKRYFNSVRLSEEIRNVISFVMNQRLTYLSEKSLTEMAIDVRNLEKNGVPGIIVETGCALGGSSLVLAAAKGKQRELRLFDTFAMIPQPSEKDGPDVHERYKTIISGQSKGIKGDTYYGYLGIYLTPPPTTHSVWLNGRGLSKYFDGS